MLRPTLNTAALCLAAVFLCTSSHAAAPIVDSHFKITFTLPDGFSNSAEFCARSKADYAFIRPPSANEHLPTIILLKGIGGPLDRKRPTNVIAPDGTLISVTTIPWKNLAIDLGKATETVQGIPFINLITLVPIRKEAVRITVAGEASREAELQTILTNFLATVDGPSNWLTDDEWYDKLASLLGFVFGIVLVIVGVLYYQNRRKS